MKFLYLFATVFIVFSISIAWSQQPEARNAPDWVKSGIMYQINARAFTKEGTLPAATAKLEDLARLGVTIVYLWPVFTADDDMQQEFWSPRQIKSGLNNPKNPYRIKDYYDIDPEYGTKDDLKAFVERAHELQMRVLFDLVYLHCGPKAVFMEDHPDFVKRDAEGEFAVSEEWPFPLLNFDNPQLREYLWNNMEYWVRDFGVDGFRWDVADRIPLDFVSEGRKRLEKIRPDIGMLAEGHRPENQLDAFDMNFGFPIYFRLRDAMDGTMPASVLVETTRTQETRQPKGGRFVLYIDNHDIANDDYDKRREHRWGSDGVQVALVACFTLHGIPMLYNGQEIADKSRHSIYGNLSVDWSKAETKKGQERWDFCRNLIRIRKAHTAFSTDGAMEFIGNDHPEAILSFVRSDENERILVVINFRNEPIAVKVQTDIASWDELFAKGKIVLSAPQPLFDLPPYGWFIGIERPCSETSKEL